MSEDCYNPVCNKYEAQDLYVKYSQKQTIFQQQFLQQQLEDNDQDDQNQNEIQQIPDSYKDCFLSKDALGYYTWSYLHTMAAYYPKIPNIKQQTLMKQFFEGFVEFYPCSYCQKYLEFEYKQRPVNVETNKDLQMWLCNLHNDVNIRLDKPIFECNEENLNKRWKTGFEHCQKDFIKK